MKLKLVACAVSALVIAAATTHASAESVGSVAAVNRDMEGTPPDGSRRALNLGDQVVSNELIETSKVGSGQIVFLDQTTLSVAPNSNVILDKYVYDPAKGEGEIALRMTQGALRFIGGRITKSKKAIVKTPQSTIGIRGGMAVITIDGSGNVAFTGIATSEDLAGVFKSLEGEGDGGTGEGISEDGVDNVSQVNSEETGLANEAPISTQGEARVGSDLELDDDSVLREFETTEVEEPDQAPPPPPLENELPLPQAGVVLLEDPESEDLGRIAVPVAEIREGSVIAVLDNEANDTLILDLPSDPRELAAFPEGAFENLDLSVGLDAEPDGSPQFGFWLSPGSDTAPASYPPPVPLRTTRSMAPRLSSMD